MTTNGTTQTVEAMQWTGDNIQDLWDWAGADKIYGPLPVGDPLRPEGQPARVYINIIETWMSIQIGDWVVRHGGALHVMTAAEFASNHAFMRRLS